MDTRAGHYKRKLQTRSGEVELRVPKLRTLPFETSIIERYRRRESSVGEALVEMYLAGVSVRRVEDITEALWGTRVSPGTVSRLNKKVYEQIEAWRNRPLTCGYPYVYLDGIYCEQRHGADHAGNPQAYPCGGELPGQPVSADAGMCPSSAHLCRHLEHENVSGHEETLRGGERGALPRNSRSGRPMRKPVDMMDNAAR